MRHQICLLIRTLLPLLVTMVFTAPVFGGPVSEEQAKVVVIGAGAAGLEAADRLRQAGVPFVVLEATERAGGRIRSRGDQTQYGLTLDEGANLINSTDTIALGLMQRYGIRHVQRTPKGSEEMNFEIDGRVVSQEEANLILFKRNEQALWKMAQDQRRLAGENKEQWTRRLINTSVEEYMNQIGADLTLRKVVASIMWSEFGKSVRDVNAILLQTYFLVDLNRRSFELIPNPVADEAYTVPEGVEQLTRGLERDNRASILYNHVVKGMSSRPDHSIAIQVMAPEGERRINAEYVIFTAPLYALNSIDINIEGVSAQALSQARAVSYGAGTKIHLKFAKGFHDLYPTNILLLTETGEQIWVSSIGQNGMGLLTVLTGPLTPQDKAQLDARVQRLLRLLDKQTPGISKLFAGYEITEAPITYSGAWRPGESPDIAINGLQGRFMIAGEAVGGDLQGYLEGALQTGRMRSDAVIAATRGFSHARAARVSESELTCRDIFR